MFAFILLEADIKEPHCHLIPSMYSIVESIRLGFSVHGVYYYLVLEWGNLAALASLIWWSYLYFSPRNELKYDLLAWLQDFRSKQIDYVRLTYKSQRSSLHRSLYFCHPWLRLPYGCILHIVSGSVSTYICH
jgi:hypothetical protein